MAELESDCILDDFLYNLDEDFEYYDLQLLLQDLDKICIDYIKHEIIKKL